MCNEGKVRGVHGNERVEVGRGTGKVFFCFFPCMLTSFESRNITEKEWECVKRRDKARVGERG